MFFLLDIYTFIFPLRVFSLISVLKKTLKVGASYVQYVSTVLFSTVCNEIAVSQLPAFLATPKTFM